MERPKCAACGSGMDAWGCVKCGHTNAAETERIFVYLPTLDTVITMSEPMALVTAEKLSAPIVFYALPSEVGHG